MRGRGLFLWPAITRRACLIVDTCRTCCLRLFRCPVVGLICCWVRCRCTAIRFATCWLIDIKCRWPLSVCGRCWSSFVLAVSPAIWCPLLACQHVRFHHLLDSHGFLFLWPVIARSFSSPFGQSWLAFCEMLYGLVHPTPARFSTSPHLPVTAITFKHLPSFLRTSQHLAALAHTCQHFTAPHHTWQPHHACENFHFFHLICARFSTSPHHPVTGITSQHLPSPRSTSLHVRTLGSNSLHLTTLKNTSSYFPAPHHICGKFLFLSLSMHFQKMFYWIETLLEIALLQSCCVCELSVMGDVRKCTEFTEFTEYLFSSCIECVIFINVNITRSKESNFCWRIECI